MIDIHSHILFGVDDGAKTIEDSINMIREEKNKGVTHIILTPHFNSKYVKISLEKAAENYEELKKKIVMENIDINIYMGNEIFLDSDYYDVLEQGGFYTLANSKYILIEFNVIDVPRNIEEICYEIRIRGHIPIIAHVERYDIFHNNIELLNDVLKEGALLQVNASTVINREGKESHKFANYLLKHKLVSFVSSDIHNLGSRGFHLDEALKLVKKSCGDEYANKIFMDNQLKVISDEQLEIPYMDYSRSKFLSRLFKNKYN